MIQCTDTVIELLLQFKKDVLCLKLPYKLECRHHTKPIFKKIFCALKIKGLLLRCCFVYKHN